MPEVIQIRPKGIYITVEYSLEEIEKIKKAYDHTKLEINSEDPEELEIKRYILEEHYPFIEKLLKDLKHGPGSNSE